MHYKDTVTNKIYGYKFNETCIPVSVDEVSEALKPSELESLILSLTGRIQEASNYLSSTGWIWEKYNRNVLVLKDLTNDEFQTKYTEIIAKQEECRLLINTLELELQGVI